VYTHGLRPPRRVPPRVEIVQERRLLVTVDLCAGQGLKHRGFHDPPQRAQAKHVLGEDVVLDQAPDAQDADECDVDGRCGCR
jgi:hypothetical protein